MTEWRTKYRIVSPGSLPLQQRLQRVKALSNQTGCEDAENINFDLSYGCDFDVWTFLCCSKSQSEKLHRGLECRTLRPIGKYLELILTRVSFNLEPRSWWGREVSCMMVSRPGQWLKCTGASPWCGIIPAKWWSQFWEPGTSEARLEA